MKQGMQAIDWVVEQHAPESVVCLTPDIKGRLVEMVCKAAAKRRKMFRYTGIQIPHETLRKLDKQHAGFVVKSLDAPAPSNAVLGIATTPEQFHMVWHCPIVLYFGDPHPWPKTCAPVAKFDGEPTLWISPRQACPQRQFKVNTRNCVEDENIQNNVINSMGLGLPCLPACAAHGEKAVLFGGGPSIVNYLNEVRVLNQTRGYRLLCVKTSHDLLQSQDITPWACLLLDPRQHVKDWISEPMPGCKYFVSSTCHPTTFDRLLSRGAEIWLYHALVGAGEHALIKMYVETAKREQSKFAAYCKQLGVPLMPQPTHRFGDQMVAGGTTAAARGVSVLYMLGFRHFILRGFDSCYFEPKDMAARKDDGQPRYHQLNLGGKNFITDAELVAQTQDFQHIVGGTQMMQDCTFDVAGDGMVPQVFRLGWKGMAQLAELFPA